jgi:lipoprotein-anchoring transpeptidase ErfK/SrfK
MKLVNLIPLKEIDFRNQDAFDAYQKQHSLRPDTKVTIAGKPTTAGQAAQKTGSSVFGKDKGGDVFGKSDSMATVNSIAAKTGLRAQAVAGWADENGVNLSNLSADIDSKKLKPMDLMTAVVGNPNNKYAKDIIAKYSQSAPKADAPKAQLPKKASELDYTHAETLEKSVNAETGLTGYVDTDDNTDAIMYNASKGMSPTYTLYFGGNADYGKPDEFRVSLLPTYDNDPSNLGDKIDKTFKSGDDAMKFMVAVAKKYKKELEMDDSNN